MIKILHAESCPRFFHPSFLIKVVSELFIKILTDFLHIVNSDKKISKWLFNSWSKQLYQGWIDFAIISKYVTAWRTTDPPPVKTLYNKARTTFSYIFLSMFPITPQSSTPSVLSLQPLQCQCLIYIILGYGSCLLEVTCVSATFFLRSNNWTYKKKRCLLHNYTFANAARRAGSDGNMSAFASAGPGFDPGGVVNFHLRY